ncbi:hypothetical protein AS888_15015 [Peribacillus simplex]|uniref:Uncharacterized protein n=1 Tax=Peribacillus simplex TaxID=1478 RepID=A0A125QS81_9BACI|nr:hypothetical protein AS888_15015 [Peribacillus simplex]
MAKIEVDPALYKLLLVYRKEKTGKKNTCLFFKKSGLFNTVFFVETINTSASFSEFLTTSIEWVAL